MILLRLWSSCACTCPRPPMADLTPGTVDALLTKAQALVNAITADEASGLITRGTIVTTDAMRAELLVWAAPTRMVGKSHHLGTTPEASNSGAQRPNSAPADTTPPAPIMGPADE